MREDIILGICPPVEIMDINRTELKKKNKVRDLKTLYSELTVFPIQEAKLWEIGEYHIQKQ